MLAPRELRARGNTPGRNTPFYRQRVTVDDLLDDAMARLKRPRSHRTGMQQIRQIAERMATGWQPGQR